MFLSDRDDEDVIDKKVPAAFLVFNSVCRSVLERCRSNRNHRGVLLMEKMEMHDSELFRTKNIMYALSYTFVAIAHPYRNRSYSKNIQKRPSAIRRSVPKCVHFVRAVVFAIQLLIGQYNIMLH